MDVACTCGGSCQGGCSARAIHGGSLWSPILTPRMTVPCVPPGTLAISVKSQFYARHRVEAERNVRGMAVWVLPAAGQRASMCGICRGWAGARAGCRNPLVIAAGGRTKAPGLLPVGLLLPFFFVIASSSAAEWLTFPAACQRSPRLPAPESARRVLPLVSALLCAFSAARCSPVATRYSTVASVAGLGLPLPLWSGVHWR